MTFIFIQFLMLEDYRRFLDMIIGIVEMVGIDVRGYELDHMCWRVETQEQFEEYKQELSKMGELLVESDVKGRLIATYKLDKPLEYGERRISVIELPAPKDWSPYMLGRQHIEFVVKDRSLVKLMEEHSDFEWEIDWLKNEINPTIWLKFADKSAVRFHSSSLEEVIEEEKNIK